METRTRAWTLVAVLVLAALPGCRKKPVDSAVGSTDTVQSTTAQTTGTTVTETGGGTPVTTSSTTGTAATTSTTTTATGTKE